ncbi:LrgB family protein [Lutibaculum baratangense]|uniref:LrgA-associated membrane protein LrgB n=1 Tax=Lutibaculum baratangense AMV1 TaxID=631454 RepID=V4R4E1_9HYPH|nr:LrgB family protein [Lutibaculum baratangense]ESR26822.1 LrgA-associated membrane protein LrgB [Lutibaculum baratangense AMV1]
MPVESAQTFWVFLATSPLFWLALTLAAYVGSDALSARLGRPPLLNPVLLSITAVGAVLVVSGTDYPTYFEGAQFVHVLLGPATVSLAIPIIRYRRELRRLFVPVFCAVAAGSLTGIGSAVLVARAFGGSELLLHSVAPKSVTAPIAMGIAREIGGLPELTAVVVILTGITGAVLVTPLMNLLRVRDWRARGFASGLAGHGIGTARALQVNATAGTYAGLALALNGLFTALVAPTLLMLLMR